jgi:hypothetical protein
MNYIPNDNMLGRLSRTLFLPDPNIPEPNIPEPNIPEPNIPEPNKKNINRKNKNKNKSSHIIHDNDHKYIQNTSPYANANFISVYVKQEKKIIGGRCNKINWDYVIKNKKDILYGIPSDFHLFKYVNSNEKTNVINSKELYYTPNSSIDDIINIIENNTYFWNVIDSVIYYDRDEMHITQIVLLQDDRTYILQKINSTFIPILKKQLSRTAYLEGIDRLDINNFITHIIFKGRLFYTAVVKDPNLSLYLCTQFYPIYNWLSD